MNRLTLAEVKQALRDHEFRRKLPPILKDDIQKYEQNPGCACNVPIYRNVLRYGADQLREFYPGRDIPNPDVELEKLAENHFTVINCHISELEDKLKVLPPGRKQIAPARYQDQVTVIVNELDLIF